MIETTDGPDGGALSCPACRLALRLVNLDELATRQCPGCAGSWLPAEALAEARARRGRAGCLDAAVQERAEVRRFDCDNDAIGNEYADQWPNRGA